MSADGTNFSFDFHELVVDSFAGGGGASTGIRMALGRCPDVAVNHDGDALAMHEVNHPHTLHIREDVWAVDPEAAMGQRQVGLLWASPDCRHFSKAKGGKPVSKKIRGLAWVVTKWADKLRPRVICLENVEEFKTAGPLIRVDGQWHPDPARKGEHFQRFVARLRKLSYHVEHRELRACDYGAPTIRKRLFLVARRDGLPIVWPAPTHGDPRSLPVQAGERLPWRTAAECIDWSIPCPSIFDRKKPLAEATLKRIAKGIQRYVIDAAEPFIVSAAHSDVSPSGVKRRGSGVRGLDQPLPTVLAGGGSQALIVPHLAHITHGGREHHPEKPLPTITCAKRGELQVVSAFLAQHNTMPHGVHPGRDAREPMSTVISTGSQQAVVTTHLTTNATDHTGSHHTEVRAFLVKYYGNERDGVPLSEPMHTLPTKDRMGLVTVQRIDYAIVDIGMRMLTPRELATAQGFPPDYVIDRRPDGSALTKTAQVRMIGNSVCPLVAAALVRANFQHEQAREKRRKAA